MSVTLISVSHNTIISNKHEEQTRHFYVDFQQEKLTKSIWCSPCEWDHNRSRHTGSWNPQAQHSLSIES